MNTLYIMLQRLDGTDVSEHERKLGKRSVIDATASKGGRNLVFLLLYCLFVSARFFNAWCPSVTSTAWSTHKYTYDVHFVLFNLELDLMLLNINIY